jgi:hypothetical protein
MTPVASLCGSFVDEVNCDACKSERILPPPPFEIDRLQDRTTFARIGNGHKLAVTPVEFSKIIRSREFLKHLLVFVKASHIPHFAELGLPSKIMNPLHEGVAGSRLAAEAEILTIFIENAILRVDDQATFRGNFKDGIDAFFDQILVGLFAFAIRDNGNIRID